MEEKAKKILREWVLPFGIEILILLFIIKFLFFFVIVPTGSMIPTIDEGSVLFAFRVHDPEKLERVYQIGREDAEGRIEELARWLEA